MAPYLGYHVGVPAHRCVHNLLGLAVERLASDWNLLKASGLNSCVAHEWNSLTTPYLGYRGGVHCVHNLLGLGVERLAASD